MEKNLYRKLRELSQNRFGPEFILADAKDADMAYGIRALGQSSDGRLHSINEFKDQIREIVRQGLVDIMLMSASVSESLTIKERLFDGSTVTPAVRANDATDIHVIREGMYTSAPSQPFASATIDHIQSGKSSCSSEERTKGANLGLYSVTFNNIPDADLATMNAYKAFRIEAENKGFNHFLEVFKPNVPVERHKISDISGFINDHIVRLMAGITSSGRPLFLKIPYMGPKPLEELCNYDPSVIVGVLGGASGTTHDAFHLVYEAKKYGARLALFGRKINAAEHQLSFIEHLRWVADDKLNPREAVKSYHGELQRMGIRPHRELAKDLVIS